VIYVLSAEAELDLVDIYDYSVSQWGEAQADVYLDGLYGAFENLTRFPKRGRLRNDLDLNVRSVLYRSHIAFYTEVAEGIAIVRVLHQSRDIDLVFAK